MSEVSEKKVSAEEAIAYLQDYIRSEQNFLEKLINTKCLLAEYLPQIEEKQLMKDADNGCSNNSFQEMAKVLKEKSFEVIKFLGQGSYGTVISVKQCNKRYAFKGISSKGKKDIRSKIRQEYDNQIDVRDCEYVVQSLSLQDYNNYFFISLEHCLCNLDNFFDLQIPNPVDTSKMEQITLNEPTVIKMIYEIASGMAHVHSKGTAIRDIKPDNIMINYNLKCQIGDFGLSKNIEVNPLMSSTNNGNFLFMAPEIYSLTLNSKESQGQNQQVFNTNVFINGDLYSLGLLLSYLILGQSFQNLIFCSKFEGGKTKLIAQLQKCLIQNDYQFQTQILNIINNLIIEIPEKRYPAAQVRQELQQLYEYFGFDKITHMNLHDNEPMVNTIREQFKNDIEFIPSFNNEEILSISQNLQQKLCPKFANDSFVFYKTWVNEGKWIKEQQDEQADDYNMNPSNHNSFIKENESQKQDGKENMQSLTITQSNSSSSNLIQSNGEGNQLKLDKTKDQQFEEELKIQQEKEAAVKLQLEQEELKKVELQQQRQEEKIKEDQRMRILAEQNRQQEIIQKQKQNVVDLQNNLIFDLYPSRPLTLNSRITIKKDNKFQIYLILFLIIIVSCEEIVFDILHILNSNMSTPFEDMHILLWVRFGLVILQIMGIFFYLDKIFVRNHTDFFVIHKSVTLLLSCFFGSISIANHLSRLQFFETMPVILFYFSLSIQAVLLIISLFLNSLTKKRHFCTIKWQESTYDSEKAYYAAYLSQSTAESIKCI